MQRLFPLLLMLLLLVTSVVAGEAVREISGNQVMVMFDSLDDVVKVHEKLSSGLRVIEGSVSCSGVLDVVKSQTLVCQNKPGQSKMILSYTVEGSGTVAAAVYGADFVVAGDTQVGVLVDNPVCDPQVEREVNGVCVPYSSADACDPNPCKQGGGCVTLLNDDSFACKCVAGTFGGICELGNPIEIVDEPTLTSVEQDLIFVVQSDLYSVLEKITRVTNLIETQESEEEYRVLFTSYFQNKITINELIEVLEK